MVRPHALFLDVGGVFLLPDHVRIGDAFARAGQAVDAGILDRAHYVASSRFTTALDAEGDWAGSWTHYLRGYTEACGIGAADEAEVHVHLDNEFADAELWVREAPGARAGLVALAATGVRLGIVSNADGLIAERLRSREILQVGPGLGVPVECVVDSGVIGVMKPNPRIFRVALDALGVDAADAWYLGDTPGIDVVGARRAGLRPVVIDPLELHHGADYARTGSLVELAELIASS